MIENEKINRTVNKLAELNRNISKEGSKIPSVKEIETLSGICEALLFENYFSCPEIASDQYELARALSCHMTEALKCYFDLERAREISSEILQSLPTVKEMLICDAEAIYKGDPAARSVGEIILAYPGFFAVMIYRMARLFYSRNIPYIPRIMTERAHRLTGIDIHPGAIIGDSFCIDHGTGVVIGETATIGSRVKIYQGVTIGAKSFEPDGAGGLVKGKKRHPDIGNDCVIYAGATILGGDTVIGDGCVIGGNVWLTHSLPCSSTVYYNEK